MTMEKEVQNNEVDFITVIPCQHSQIANIQMRVVINRLYFWYNNEFDHPINENTIGHFLLHVRMFGATVFPNSPEKGCQSIDGDIQFRNGEISVEQILYKGDVIYCRC